MSSDKNINRLSETHSEISATSYPKTSFIRISEAIKPLGDAPTPIQESRHMAATPPTQQQIEMDPADREGN